LWSGICKLVKLMIDPSETHLVKEDGITDPEGHALKASPRRRLGVHAPSTDLRLARLGARLARLGVQPPHLARRPPYRLENRASFFLARNN